MDRSVFKQAPQGEDLTCAIFELKERELRQREIAPIQRGLDASNDPNAPRTTHAEFMLQLNAEIMPRINAR